MVAFQPRALLVGVALAPAALLRAALSPAARRTSAALLVGLIAAGCAAVPREVHEPRQYPETKLSAGSITLEVVDSRPAPTSPEVRQLLLPSDFETAALGRLNRMLGGQGPALEVIAYVNDGAALEIADARGEMTRVSVKLDFEVKVKDGPQLRRAQVESSADLPRDEATPEEISLLLRSTSLDAFDRYWADAKTTTALNGDLASYGGKQAK
jgi:hypothetical protein